MSENIHLANVLLTVGMNYSSMSTVAR